MTTPAPQLDRVMRTLHGRKASGPTCGWCEAAAQDYEAEYCIDHNAGSDFLQFADDQRAACRGGLHTTEDQFARRCSRVALGRDHS